MAAPVGGEHLGDTEWLRSAIRQFLPQDAEENALDRSVDYVKKELNILTAGRGRFQRLIQKVLATRVGVKLTPEPLSRNVKLLTTLRNGENNSASFELNISYDMVAGNLLAFSALGAASAVVMIWKNKN